MKSADGKIVEVYSDACEPEGRTFYRDFSFVVDLAKRMIAAENALRAAGHTENTENKNG